MSPKEEWMPTKTPFAPAALDVPVAPDAPFALDAPVVLDVPVALAPG